MFGSEMQWIGEYAGGTLPHRNRDNEFKEPEETVKGLVALLDQAKAASRAALAAQITPARCATAHCTRLSMNLSTPYTSNSKSSSGGPGSNRKGARVPPCPATT